MKYLVWTLMASQALAKLGVCALLTSRGMLRHYPVLLAVLATGALKTAYIGWIWYTEGGWAANALWKTLKPIDMLLHGVLTSDVLYHISRHFRDSRMLSGIWGMFALVTCLVVAYTERILTPPWKTVEAGLLAVSRDWVSVCFGTLFLAWAYYFFDRVNWRRNTARYRIAALLALGGDTAAYTVLRYYKAAYWPTVGGQVLLQLAPLLACCIYMRLDEAGEHALVPREPEQQTDARLARASV